MYKLIYETIIIGIITAILGHIIIRILSKYNKYDDNEKINNFLIKYNKGYILELSMFLTGIFVHLLVEYIGLNNWYCQKKCIKDKCRIICEKEI